MEKIKLEIFLDKETYTESLKQYDLVKNTMVNSDGDFTYQKYLEYLITTFIKGNKQVIKAKESMGGLLEKFKDQLGGMDLEESMKNFDMDSFLDFFKNTKKEEKPKEAKKNNDEKLKS